MKRTHTYNIKAFCLDDYEAAIHDMSAETAKRVVSRLAKRYKISKQEAERRLIYVASWYCYPEPSCLPDIWEYRVDGAARSYDEQIIELELRP